MKQKMKAIFYTRVSRNGQTIDCQVKDLREAGCVVVKVLYEKISGFIKSLSDGQEL